ncbi:unnamed protein product [Acanthosepion pharaonis]|uniref:Fascin domain-containing protein n=1 Tax=Acanthosepion pharaonis TaxID=158019 RepID=A0A812C1F7_ACAPH|nr:unnamed protein product [Sepia pharaonis]
MAFYRLFTGGCSKLKRPDLRPILFLPILTSGGVINLRWPTITKIQDVQKLQRAFWIQSYMNPLLNLFRTGNVVQLVSKMTGCTLQILQTLDGKLIVDAKGSVGYGAFNASWTVINEGENKVRLHNNNNYLAIVDGYTQVVRLPPDTKHGVETKFHVSQAGEWALFQSVHEPNHYIAVFPDGYLRPAKDSIRGPNAHFGVQLISSPYAQTHPKK